MSNLSNDCGDEEMREFKVYGREVVITEEMDKILKIFHKWGIDYAFSDSDNIDIVLEILDAIRIIEK